MPRKKTKIENPPISNGTEKLQCWIHDDVGDAVGSEELREKVCINDEPLTKHTDGNYYCLFHKPTKEKDIVKFEAKVQTRLKAVDNEFAIIEKLLPKKEQEKAKIKLSYDFQYVWFPSDVNFGENKFGVKANFSCATFSAKAYLIETTFSSDVDFHWAEFSADVNFSFATFSAKANFFETKFSARSDFSAATFLAWSDFSAATFSASASFTGTTFSASAYFSGTIFTAGVYFNETTFSASTNFDETIFSDVAFFSEAIFEDKSQIFFRQTKFSGALNFYYTNFKGYVAIEGKQKNQLFIGDKALLDLQNARIDDAKKISFHTVRLEPSWFINTNATGFVFSDCVWQYADGKRLSVKTELDNLKKRGFENPNALLMYTCWHLADNYEESKSFRKASLFRQMANESRRLETSWYWQPFTLRWWYYFSSWYGESWVKAMTVLIILIFLVFPAIYTQINFQTCSKDRPIATSLTICESKDEEIRKNCTCSTNQITFTDANVQSLTTATLQNVEYRKPLTVWGEFWIILEKIFAPLQAALLALAIRRKFIR